MTNPNNESKLPIRGDQPRPLLNYQQLDGYNHATQAHATPIATQPTAMEMAPYPSRGMPAISYGQNAALASQMM